MPLMPHLDDDCVDQEDVEHAEGLLDGGGGSVSPPPLFLRKVFELLTLSLDFGCGDARGHYRNPFSGRVACQVKEVGVEALRLGVGLAGGSHIICQCVEDRAEASAE
jgi:hypothetical protein